MPGSDWLLTRGGERMTTSEIVTQIQLCQSWEACSMPWGPPWRGGVQDREKSLAVLLTAEVPVARQGDCRLYNEVPGFPVRSIPSLMHGTCHRMLGAGVPAKANALAPQAIPAGASHPHLESLRGCIQSLHVRGSPGAGLLKHQPAGKQETQISP